jgi:hypothetical protein
VAKRAPITALFELLNATPTAFLMLNRNVPGVGLTDACGLVGAFGLALTCVVPATYLVALLLAPKPFLFLEVATMFSDFPLAIFFIVQVVFELLMVHDLPAKDTLLPVIFDPPVFFGSAIFTVTSTSPFLGFEDFTETIVGAVGFVTLALETNA